MINFATTNKKKFEEASLILADYNIEISMLESKPIEIQADKLEDVAAFAARCLTERYNMPIIVEDAGLFIEVLNGFPGPYSAFVFKTIGNKGILKLMEGMRKRKARFCSVVAYCEPELEPICFHGVVEGVIVLRERGTRGFGFDPIFQPIEGNGRTFAEMKIEEKNALSHRARAFRKFAGWYVRNKLGGQLTS